MEIEFFIQRIALFSLSCFIAYGNSQALNQTVCHYPNGAVVNLTCPLLGNKVITLIDAATLFYRPQSSSSDAVCIGNQDCCTRPQPYCHAIANKSFPNLFKSWQDKCDGQNKCSFEVYPVPLYDECNSHSYTSCQDYESCFSRELLIFHACFNASEESTTESLTSAETTTDTTTTTTITYSTRWRTTSPAKTETESLQTSVIVFMVLCLFGIVAIILLLVLMMCRSNSKKEIRPKPPKQPVPRPVGPIIRIQNEDSTRQTHGAQVLFTMPRESVYVNSEYVDENFASNLYEDAPNYMAPEVPRVRKDVICVNTGNVQENFASNLYEDTSKCVALGRPTEKKIEVIAKHSNTETTKGTKAEHVYDALKREGNEHQGKVAPKTKPKPKPPVMKKPTAKNDRYYENVGFSRDGVSVSNENCNGGAVRDSEVVFMENTYYEPAGARESKSQA